MNSPKARLRKPRSSKRTGRPARIDPIQIVKTAIEIGLSQVTVKEVAERLGVTPPAIYRHVRNRDDIIELAVRELALSKVQPTGNYTHWVDVIRGTAQGMFEILVAEPQLICEVVNGTPGANGEIDYVELFLEALTPFGFSPAEGVRIHHTLAMIAMGASVMASRIKSGYGEGVSHRESVTQALERRPANELPLIRKGASAFKNLEERQWHELVDLVISDIATSRGEQIPLPLRRRIRNRKSTGTR